MSNYDCTVLKKQSLFQHNEMDIILIYELNNKSINESILMCIHIQPAPATVQHSQLFTSSISCIMYKHVIYVCSFFFFRMALYMTTTNKAVDLL